MKNEMPKIYQANWQLDGHPLKVTLCGSTRFKKQFEYANMVLSLNGFIVYSVSQFSHADGISITDYQSEQLSKNHFKKIELSDAILVIDLGDYIGEATQKEIDYAKALGKSIKYFNHIFPDYNITHQ